MMCLKRVSMISLIDKQEAKKTHSKGIFASSFRHIYPAVNTTRNSTRLGLKDLRVLLSHKTLFFFSVIFYLLLSLLLLQQLGL